MTEKQREIVSQTIHFVKATLADAEGGHDWWHVYRVWKLSRHIVAIENADPFIVELAALLHDIADAKFHEGDEDIGPQKAADFLKTRGVDKSVIAQIVKIIDKISFKGGNFKKQFSSPELNVVQDADRLDAMGAIGIARTFNFGGYKNREIFNPEILPRPNMTKEQYKQNNGPTINHFYEKLLLLKERMNTQTGKALAEKRHLFMKQFLDEFFDEWQLGE